jgi:hypothetical protein
METDNIAPNTENIDDIKIKNDPFLEEKDKQELIKLNNRIKFLENEMNNLAKKIETDDIEKKAPLLKKLDDINKEGVEKENIYFKLKSELDSMTPETDEQKNIRLKDKIDEIEKVKIEVDNIKNEYESILVPEPIEKPINKSKYSMDKYDIDVANRDKIKNNKIRLSNLLNSKNLSYNNLKSELDKLKNIESPYDIIYNKCKIAYEECNQMSDIFENTKKELADINKIISKDQFNGNTLYNEVTKLYNIQTGLINKGVYYISIDPVTKKTVVTEYDIEGNKKIVFSDLGEELYNRNLHFKKLDDLESNPPTYIYTVGDMLLEFERDSFKTLLSYELSNYNNFIDSSDPEYNHSQKELIKKEIIEIRKKIKEVDKKINDLPRHEWIEVDQKALEIEKNKIISSMSERTHDIYLNEQKDKEVKRKEELRDIENREFKINNYQKSLFQKYINSLGSIKNDNFLKNKAINILNCFE